LSRDAHLEYMECLELDVFTLVPQEVHHHLEIGFVADIPSHHIEVSTVEEDLPEQLERLPFRHIVVG